MLCAISHFTRICCGQEISVSRSILERCPYSRGDHCHTTSCFSKEKLKAFHRLSMFVEWTIWLLVNSIDRTDILFYCWYLVLYFWLYCTFRFWNHFSKYFSKYLHLLVCEPGAFQLTSAPQGCEAYCFLATLNQSMARSQVYPSHSSTAAE